MVEFGRFTKRGYIALGETVRAGLTQLGWEQQDLVAELNQRGRRTTNPELSRFVNAEGQKPDGSLVLAIARVNQRLFRENKPFLINPQTAAPYSSEDLFDIACELLDPKTGLRANETARVDDEG